MGVDNAIEVTLHPRLLLVVLALLAGSLIAAPTASARHGCVSANATTAHATKRAIVRATLCALNHTRHHHGLHRLRLNKRLSRAARRHARVDGIGTECGMARGDPARLPALLAAHARVAESA